MFRDVFTNRIIFCLYVVFILGIFPNDSNAQRLVDKNKGNHNNNRKGFMNGNLVETVYYNMGEVADWQNEPNVSGVWPKGTNPPQTYVDGVAIIVQAETEDPFGNIIHPLETNYYEYTRHNPATGVTYGWWALPGYFNPYQSRPAMSGEDNKDTWPDSWPDRPDDWDGAWNGFFGKGEENANLETYFVFDDNEDREYLLNHSFFPDAEDSTRGGLGMQVRARGFQWVHVLAEDVIFWFYEITNMSTTDYEKTLFGQYIDWGIGGHNNSSNNAGDYNELFDISYAWSTVSFGSPGHWSPVGRAGYAFLESPGISDDFRDNDTDGLTDERRDNEAVNFINNPSEDPFLVDVFQDTINFLKFYNYSWRPHWDADENADWKSFFDANENGEWDEEEPLYDDVGSDGIGPLSGEYTGPDPDGSEANGRPDQGEPNFGILDKNESDQLGLTGFLIFPAHTPYDLDNDEQNWQALSALPEPHGKQLIGVNLVNFFSSYLFHLNGRDTYGFETGETERFSMSLIFGLDNEDLFRRKRTVQQIYNANYRFAKPPEKPIVNSVAGDGRVTLYWDSRAERTFDAFLQKFNFEGYRIYRSTEPTFLENKVITDAYGKVTFRKPLAQFDLIDGVTGLHPIHVQGAMFDLGTDTGLRHSFIDSTVENGQTYYYAVVSYDQGFTTTTVEGEFLGISPSECSSIIKVDVNGRIIKTDINTAVVTPHAPAAGYIAAEVQRLPHDGPGTGTVSIDILEPDSLMDNHIYRLEFENYSAFHNDPNPSYRLLDYTEMDTLIKSTLLLGNDEQTIAVDGFSINIKNDPSTVVDYSKTGWKEGGGTTYIDQVGFNANYVAAYGTRRLNYPADFEVTFMAEGQGDLSFPATSFSKPQSSNIVIKNITEDIDHVQFIFRDNNKDSLFNGGDAIFIVAGDSAGLPATTFPKSFKSWSLTFITDTTIEESQQQPPQEGDVYQIIIKKPFRSDEYFQFTTKAPGFDRTKAESDLDLIAVVPNPYVGAASWEPNSSTVGRGERRLYFINLPQKCTIRIYTMSGSLVDTIQHDAAISNGQEAWDLISRDGMNIAFGVYAYHVDAPGIGEKIGRFAIVK